MFHRPLILLQIVQLILFIVDSGCTKHMTGKFLGTACFGNDQFAPILGYGDLNQGNVTIKQGNNLLTGNRGSDLYTISLQETTSSTPICFMAKASPTQAWLWHRRLSHLNFDYITLLSKKDIVTGLPKLKYVKDQLCSSSGLNVVPPAEKTDSSQQGLEFLFSPLLEEYCNPTHSQAEENNNDQAPNASFQEDEFINPFCTRVQEIDHPLEQVRGNPTMPVQTRRQLVTDPEMCMFALTVSIVEPKNIKEAMADTAWIEAIQDELH
ncbi:retrovirus-related pol polyprotein from transposon TNT 1-94 [Tanacetum coccineum]